MAGPTGNEPDWASKGEVRTDTVIYKDASGKIQQGPSGGGIAGIGDTQYRKYSRVLFANGETWDIPDDGGPSEQVDFSAGMSAAFRANTAAGARDTATEAAAAAKVEAARVAAEERTAANQRYYDLNTGARYIPQSGAPGTPDLGAEGGVSAPPGIPPGWVANINYDPKTSALDLAYKQAQIDSLNRGNAGTDNSSAWARLAWERERAAQEDAMKREVAAAAYKQFVEEQARTDARNRLTNTTQFTNNLLDTWVKAAPMAATPGQLSGASPWYLGFEPGGPMAQSVRMGGGTYDPNLYKAPIVNIDPQTALEWARNAAAGGK